MVHSIILLLDTNVRLIHLTVEDYPSGYPRFAALISTHPSFNVFRRFTDLHARVLLSKQDRLSVLESQLHRLDESEPFGLHRGSFRHDGNGERIQLLADIDSALADYGSSAPATACFTFDRWKNIEDRVFSEQEDDVL